MGFLVFLVLTGRTLELGLAVATAVPIVAAGVNSRKRYLAHADGVEMALGCQRGHRVTKYAGPVLVIVGALVVAGAAVWLIPADLC